MLHLFGLENRAGLFPPVRPSDTIGGAVTEAAAAETGLGAGRPVAIGAGDVPCSAIAAGAVETGMACTILGATCHNGVVVDRPLFEPPNIGPLFTLPDSLWLLAGAQFRGLDRSRIGAARGEDDDDVPGADRIARENDVGEAAIRSMRELAAAPSCNINALARIGVTQASPPARK
ncbi:MAG TPA: hypothetical protein VFE63_01685 [Roseiarcus sp.]|jgi:hypothetical protein|nr:hypothetical protein [Roseiarcus sp.]